MPGPEKLRPVVQGKYGVLRKCHTCKSVHRCSYASPRIIANYCAANHIEYPADLVKSRRCAKKTAEAPVSKGKSLKPKPKGKGASRAAALTEPASQQPDNVSQPAQGSGSVTEAPHGQVTDDPTPVQEVDTDEPLPGPSGPQEIKIAHSFEELCTGVTQALQPMVAALIAQAFRDGQASANLPQPPAKKAKMQEEPHLSDDEEDFFPEGTVTEDVSQTGPPQNTTGQAKQLPDDATLLQLSQNLEAYLTSKSTDREPPTPSAKATGGLPAAEGTQQHVTNPPLGQAKDLAQKWDDIAVVPFKVQPELALRGKKSRATFSNDAAVVFMQAAGVSG